MPTSTYGNKRGGARPGSGRKPGSGPFGEATRPIRIPTSMATTVKALVSQANRNYTGLQVLGFTEQPTALHLPLFSSKVSAGFPSPADDYVEKTLDLNDLLVQKPAATFFVRAQGESMLGAGIHPNDVLVVDRSLEPAPGKIVVCALNGELTVKRLGHRNGQWQLQADNPAYADIGLHEELELVIWGVVTNVIHPV